MEIDSSWPEHIKQLISNVSEVLELPEIHRKLSGEKRGRRHGLEILNKSAVVLLVACWEAFIEDLATNAFDHALATATTPAVFPARVLTMASRDLKDHNDERQVWLLAGTGWKKVLRNHREAVLKRHVGSLNTPRAKQVNALMEDLIGLNELSSHWKWTRMANTKAVDYLESLVTRRGEIAHRVEAEAPVLKKDVLFATSFVTRIAVISSNRVCDYLAARTKTPRPWIRIAYASVS